MLDQNNFREQGRSRVIRFIIAEAVSVGILLLAGSFAVLSRLTNSTLALSVNIVTIAAAVAVALIPIAYFAMTPVLPGRR